jgi:eukaryotic translation initiation factor 2C
VSIEPAVTNKKVSRDIFKKMRETFGEAECGGKNGAYDGEKSFFTSGSLNFNTKEFPVFLDDRKGPTFRPGDRGGRPGDSPTQSPPPGKSSIVEKLEQLWFCKV